MIVPITNLNESEVTLTIQPHEYAYFKYDIEYSTKIQYLLISGKPKTDQIQFFSSTQTMYPNEKNYTPISICYMPNSMGIPYICLDPFIANSKDMIEYKTDLKSIINR